MKMYSKILGILTTLVALYFLGTVVYFLFFDSNFKDKILLLTALIPIYSVLHFTIIHRFGFNFGREYSNPHGRIILISSLVLFGLLGSVSVWGIVAAIRDQEEETEINKLIEGWKAESEKTKIWHSLPDWGLLGHFC